MPCFYPLIARKTITGEIVFKKKDDRHFKSNLQLPCGRCIGCKLERARQWAVRCLHESQLHEANCFVTLTIAPLWEQRTEKTVLAHRGKTPVDKTEEARELSTNAEIARRMAAPSSRENANVGNSRSLDSSAPASSQSKLDRSASCLPPDPEAGLSVKHHQKFMKRLRKRTGETVRFYMCGEYGEKLDRPHYHYLIFGYDFPDKKYFKKTESGETLYTSETLDQIWPYGHAWIGAVTYESCAYVASYVMKKITGDKADEHYKRVDAQGQDFWLMPEFNLMSRRPGIAADWWNQFHADVTTHDAVIQPGGIKAKPPRYYDKLLELMDPQLHATIKATREARGKLLAADNTPARLKVKETVTKARVSLKKRNLENS